MEKEKENEIDVFVSVDKMLQKRNKFLLILALGVVAFSITGHFLPNYPAIVFASWLIGAVAMINLIVIGFSKCPNCEKQFFWTWYFSNPLSNRCMHCGQRAR